MALFMASAADHYRVLLVMIEFVRVTYSPPIRRFRQIGSNELTSISHTMYAYFAGWYHTTAFLIYRLFEQCNQ